jgi:hypothetical protein
MIGVRDGISVAVCVDRTGGRAGLGDKSRDQAGDYQVLSWGGGRDRDGNWQAVRGVPLA